MSTRDSLIKNCAGTATNNTGYVPADPLNGVFEVQELALPPEINLNRMSADGNFAYGIYGGSETNLSASYYRDMGSGIAHIVYTTDGWDTYDWFKMPSNHYYEQMVLSPDGVIAAAILIVKTRNGWGDYINNKYLKIFLRSTVSGKYVWTETSSRGLGFEKYKIGVLGPSYTDEETNIFNMVMNGPSLGSYTLEFLYSPTKPSAGTTIFELYLNKATKQINSTTGVISAETTTANSYLHPRVTPLGNWSGIWPYRIDYDYMYTVNSLLDSAGGRKLEYYNIFLSHTEGPDTLTLSYGGGMGSHGAAEILFVNILSPTKLFSIAVDSNVNYARNRYWSRFGSIILRGTTNWNKEIMFAGYDNHYDIVDTSAIPPIATCLVSTNTTKYNYPTVYDKAYTPSDSLFYDVTPSNTPYFYIRKDTTQLEELQSEYKTRRFGIVKIDSTIY